MKEALSAVGADFADVVKLNYYCVESVPPEALPIVAEIRDRFVNKAAPPASTFVVVKRLVRSDWLVEIEATAVADRERA